MISADWIKIIQAWADPVPSISAVYLYGSWAKGTNHSESDVDLGVFLAETGLDAEFIWYDFHTTWEQYLESALGCKVQLELANEEVSPDTVFPAIREHGIQIFKRENK